MLTFGAHMDKRAYITSDGIPIATSATIVAIVAGLMIFPIVFQFNLDPAMGMGLIFSAMPLSFLQIPAGSFVGGLFFSLAAIGALSSSTIMIMLATAILEEQARISRIRSVLTMGAIAWIVGALCVLYPRLSGEIDSFQVR